MERKKRSKGSVWEFCYANKIFGTFGDEIKAFGQKLVTFCTHTHTHTHTRAAKLVVEMYLIHPPFFCRSAAPHRQKYPAIVRLNFCHNHPIHAADAMRRRDVSESTRLILEDLLLKGYRPAAALDLSYLPT